MSANIWKLQDAKARFSELVRRARAGEPQQVTVHGKRAVVVVDPSRFELTPKEGRQENRTMAGFLDRSRQYDLELDVDFDRPIYMKFPSDRLQKQRRKRR